MQTVFLRGIGARAFAASLLAGAALVGIAVPASSSSHSDAPRIKQDPQANLTDVYAFVGTRYDDPSVEMLNIIAHVRPFSEPGDGPHYERFADDALYSLHITDPATGETFLRYDFQFTAVDGPHRNKRTILSYGRGSGNNAGSIGSVGDANQNYSQEYEVFRTGEKGAKLIGRGVIAPPNPGKNVTPFYNDADGRAVSGAASFGELDVYTQQSIFELASGEVTFAGPRDDSFYADIPGVFDLLDARILENDGNGVDGFKGFNILAFGIQVPLDQLPKFTYNSVFFGEQQGVGVYASVSRPKKRVLRPDGTQKNSGGWVQVNRMGNPLFNEGLVALQDKDRFNMESPPGDAQFAKYASNPELAALINLVFGTEFETTNRQDLVNIFIPEVLRVNTTTGPVRLSGQENFSRLGFLGGDTTGGVSSGWPNGRRLGDDVVDIALIAIASGPGYSEITLLGDNVNGNDIEFHQVFPYSATPHAGTFNRKDPVE